MTDATINGMQMYFEIHGRGEPLLLLHGFSGAGSNWQGFVGGFSREYQLIIPDLRGHGRSINPSGEFTFRQSALDIFALLDHMVIPNGEHGTIFMMAERFNETALAFLRGDWGR